MASCCGGEGLRVRGLYSVEKILLSHCCVSGIVPDELIMPTPLRYSPPDLPVSRFLQDGKEEGGAVGWGGGNFEIHYLKVVWRTRCT